MDIYVSTHGSKVGILGGKLTVTFPDDTLQTFPFNTIKSVFFYKTIFLITLLSLSEYIVN